MLESQWYLDSLIWIINVAYISEGQTIIFAV